VPIVRPAVPVSQPTQELTLAIFVQHWHASGLLQRQDFLDDPSALLDQPENAEIELIDLITQCQEPLGGKPGRCGHACRK
jgi:hypothetical protein